jgi:hypothetical protein
LGDFLLRNCKQKGEYRSRGTARRAFKFDLLPRSHRETLCALSRWVRAHLRFAYNALLLAVAKQKIPSKSFASN